MSTCGYPLESIYFDVIFEENFQLLFESFETVTERLGYGGATKIPPTMLLEQQATVQTYPKYI